MWSGLQEWGSISKAALNKLNFGLKKQFSPKRSYGLTSHINVFQVCPRQYQYYQELKFSPSRSADDDLWKPSPSDY